MYSFSKSYETLTKEKQIIIELGSKSIWNEDWTDFGVSIALFNYHQMRQFSKNEIKAIMVEFQKTLPGNEEEDYFNLPFLKVDNKTNETFLSIQARLPYYQRMLIGELTANEIAEGVADPATQRMEIAAAKVASYKISKQIKNQREYWIGDSMEVYFQFFALSMLYSIALYAKKLRKEIKLKTIQNHLPKWFKSKFKLENSLPSPLEEEMLSSVGFWIDRSAEQVKVKRVRIDESGESRIQILLEIKPSLFKT